MIINEIVIIGLFMEADDFCKDLDAYNATHTLQSANMQNNQSKKAVFSGTT